MENIRMNIKKHLDEMYPVSISGVEIIQYMWNSLGRA
jgi:hypothetical protein